MTEEVYQQLAYHLSTLEIGCPLREEMIEMLRLNFTSSEAEVALALPTNVAPLHLATTDEIGSRVNLPKEELVAILEELTQRL